MNRPPRPSPRPKSRNPTPARSIPHPPTCATPWHPPRHDISVASDPWPSRIAKRAGLVFGNSASRPAARSSQKRAKRGSPTNQKSQIAKRADIACGRRRPAGDGGDVPSSSRGSGPTVRKAVGFAHKMALCAAQCSMRRVLSGKEEKTHAFRAIALVHQAGKSAP